jgi:hypothetical protein
MLPPALRKLSSICACVPRALLVWVRFVMVLIVLLPAGGLREMYVQSARENEKCAGRPRTGSAVVWVSYFPKK